MFKAVASRHAINARPSLASDSWRPEIPFQAIGIPIASNLASQARAALFSRLRTIPRAKLPLEKAQQHMHQPATMKYVPPSGKKFTNDLPERVELALRRSPQLCGCDLTCEQRGASIILTGRVTSYYLKQIAQTVAGTVEGVHRVVNDVDVFQPL